MIKQAQLYLKCGSIQNLGQRSVFNQVDFLKTTKDAGVDFLNRCAPAPLKIQVHPLAGRCVVTTRALSFGEVICKKEPIFQKPKNNYPLVMPYTDLPEENQKFLELKMTEHKDNLSQENKMIFEQLGYHDPKMPNVSRVYSNSFLFRLYGHFSLINHSCFGNVIIDLYNHKLIATRDIDEGEELVMNMFGGWDRPEFCKVSNECNCHYSKHDIPMNQAKRIQGYLFFCLYHQIGTENTLYSAEKWYAGSIYNKQTQLFYDALESDAKKLLLKFGWGERRRAKANLDFDKMLRTVPEMTFMTKQKLGLLNAIRTDTSGLSLREKCLKEDFASLKRCFPGVSNVDEMVHRMFFWHTPKKETEINFRETKRNKGGVDSAKKGRRLPKLSNAELRALEKRPSMFY